MNSIELNIMDKPSNALKVQYFFQLKAHTTARFVVNLKTLHLSHSYKL